jgi:hypothetical protein
MNRAWPLAAIFVAILGSVALALGCAGVKPTATTGTGGTGNVLGIGGSGGAVTTPMPCQGLCTDFKADPVIISPAPANAATIFGSAGSGSPGGPCLLEPQDNSLFPNNWLRPRFRFTAGQGLYEIRLHASNQANDQVIYTTDTTWTMEKMMWTNLAAHTRDLPIEVTVRSAPPGGGTVQLGSKVTFTIAPVGAYGKLVYWSTSGTTYFNGKPNGTETVLSGFAVGDEGVIEVLRPYVGTTPQVAMQTYDQGANLRPVTCIGCHTSTPDGAYIAFNDFDPWGAVLASGSSPGAKPPSTLLGVGGTAAITQPWVGITSFSPKHWAPGDHIMVAPLGTCTVNNVPLQPCNSGNAQDMDQQSGLAWFDLESAAMPMMNNLATSLRGSAWNWIYAPTTGLYAAAPSWSHDGTKVLFTMTDKVKSGRLSTSANAHLYTVPYSKTSAQTPTAVALTGPANRVEYYGALSADDRFVAYNENASADANATHRSLDSMDWGTSNEFLDGMYAQPNTEIYVSLAAGDMKRRLSANDPPLCPSGQPQQPKSPGLNNSWPKWSPQVDTAGNRTYYWLIFSSWRDGGHYGTGGPIAQLYMTAVTYDEINIQTNYPAIYLWNQPATSSNHTPAWDRFQIPDVM